MDLCQKKLEKVLSKQVHSAGREQSKRAKKKGEGQKKLCFRIERGSLNKREPNAVLKILRLGD